MEVYIGTIMMFGGNFAPSGWAMCNGQLLPIQQNAALFSILGVAYGGDGVRNFALPNLQGRIPLGMGTGTGGSTYVWGQHAGSETVTLTTNQLPAHSHSVTAQDAVSDQISPSGALLAHGGTKQAPLTIYTQGTGHPATMASSMIGPTGGNQPLSIVQPYLAINFIIALTGIFPSRS